MPNIKSAIKRVEVIKTKTLKNNITKSTYKTSVKKFEDAIATKNLDTAKVLLANAVKEIDQAESKGVIKKNTASRKKSRLSKMLNALNA